MGGGRVGSFAVLFCATAYGGEEVLAVFLASTAEQVMVVSLSSNAQVVGRGNSRK
jgi:hypothetical protein